MKKKKNYLVEEHYLASVQHVPKFMLRVLQICGDLFGDSHHFLSWEESKTWKHKLTCARS